ncbi:hypothetical protein FHP25_13240 [Vineibacter terrae]|uniref:Uncharacterized protein n=1 Tax=Vineibacter terrae TaxID=2586908 RepID=A0A5C8PMD8_9HYPH|nr:hypothetical protein [Vineibacter terrae]TXL75614.1 hypothetical protein FHP25_13240 [Vineibacter terrae]
MVQPITKIEVASRQVATAIELVLSRSDIVSAHTLAFAARDILANLCQHRRIRVTFDDIFLACGPALERDLRFHLRKHYTFFKHADRDPDATLDLHDDRYTDFVLIECLERLKALGAYPPQCAFFPIWVQFCTPGMFMGGPARVLFEPMQQLIHLWRRDEQCVLGLMFSRLMQDRKSEAMALAASLDKTRRNDMRVLEAMFPAAMLMVQQMTQQAK